MSIDWLDVGRNSDLLVVLFKFNVGIRAGFDFVHDVDNRCALIRRLVPNVTALIVGHTAPYPSRYTAVGQ